MCAYLVLPTAVVGAIIPASWGNQARDNDAYLHGDAGTIAFNAGATFAGAVAAAAGLSGTTLNLSGILTLADLIDNAILPGRLHQTVLTGFLRAGTWTYAYNGDGTIASQVMSAAGPLNGYALTYEYSSGRISAVRLRSGGAAGTILYTISYTYDGVGRIATEANS